MPEGHVHNWVIRYQYWTTETERFTIYRCTEGICYAQKSEYDYPKV